MCVFPAPVMLFPMDVIDRNILIGHLNGTIHGGPSTLPGIRGNALYFDGLPGSLVDYGVHTEGCFFDPHQCDQGITLSIWLALHDSSSRFKIILESGGCNTYGIGFCIYFDGSGLVYFIVRYKINVCAINVPEPTVFQWNLFTATFTMREFAMFTNGCNCESYCTKSNVPRKYDCSQNSTFHMGDVPWHSLPSYTPHVAIDELMIWYRVLPSDEVWSFYVQGG